MFQLDEAGFIVCGHLYFIVLHPVPAQQSDQIIFPKALQISESIVIWSHILHWLIVQSSCLWYLH